MRARCFCLAFSLLSLGLVGCPADNPRSGGALVLDAGPLSADASPRSTDLQSGIADASPADDLSSGTPDSRRAGGDSSASGPQLTIVVAGVTTPAGDLSPSSQTPKPYSYGLQRLELLRNVDDPAPVVIFDYAPGDVVVDMHAENVVAKTPMSGLPDGTFRYFRIVLTTLQATVSATLHDVPVVKTLTTPVDIVYALSDTTWNGTPLKQGDAQITISVAGQEFTTSNHWPVVYPEPAPSAWAEAVANKSQVTFALAPALKVSSESLTDLTYVIRYQVAGSFEWVDDTTQADFADGVWDIRVGAPPTAETVIRFGATGYDVFRKEQ